MAYDSDTRVKEKFKEISRDAQLENLKLRIFDESNEDQKHWMDGGLTFGPKTCHYGSNDAAWFYEEPFSSNNKKNEYIPAQLQREAMGQNLEIQEVRNMLDFHMH